VRTVPGGVGDGRLTLSEIDPRHQTAVCASCGSATLAVPDRTIQRAIDPEEADLSLDSHVPQTQIATLRTDPARSRRLSVNTTGSLRFLVLGTHRRAGAIADVRVRRAEIDQRIMRDAPLVPLIWENSSFRWASRVHGWCYNPWTFGPRPHRRVAGPPKPLTAAKVGVAGLEPAASSL
jgi:hypothetical protein